MTDKNSTTAEVTDTENAAPIENAPESAERLPLLKAAVATAFIRDEQTGYPTAAFAAAAIALSTGDVLRCSWALPEVVWSDGSKHAPGFALATIMAARDALALVPAATRKERNVWLTTEYKSLYDLVAKRASAPFYVQQALGRLRAMGATAGWTGYYSHSPAVHDTLAIAKHDAENLAKNGEVVDAVTPEAEAAKIAAAAKEAFAAEQHSVSAKADVPF